MAQLTGIVQNASEILVTKQEYKGPNVTLWGAKCIKSMTQMEPNGTTAGTTASFTATKHTTLSLQGYVDLSVTGTDDGLDANAQAGYKASIFFNAPIGSEYKAIICNTTGTVINCKKFLKVANAGVRADWAWLLAVPGIPTAAQIPKVDTDVTRLVFAADAT